MFQRISNLIKGMVDKGLSDAETPEILAEQAQEQMETELKTMKKALVDSVTNEKMLEGQLKKHEQELVEVEKRAAMSVERGDDELAKQCLIKRQSVKQTVESVTEQLAQQKTATGALKQRTKEVEEKLAEFIRKKPSLTARAKAGDAMSKANELMGNASGTGGMDKWENKIREKEARGEALAEMNKDAVTDAAFKKAHEESEVDMQLAALKAKMAGGGSDMPKLVVDQQKEQVDDNVPMVRPNKATGQENVPSVVDAEIVDDDKK